MRSLGLLLLSYNLFLIFILTFTPFNFQWPGRINIHSRVYLFDFISNILLFIPPGFLYRYATAKTDKKRLFSIFLYGCLISFVIEFTQIFLQGRYSSPLDILTNGLGAWIGAFIYDFINRKIHRKLIGKLFLDLPLMTVIYMLLPLIWLDSLVRPEISALPWSLLLLGIVGSLIISVLYIDRFKPHGILSPNSVSMISGFVFLSASLPGLLLNPFFIILSGLLIIVVVRISVSLLNPGRGGGKRFEIYIIRRVLPFYALYLLFQALLPFESLTNIWHAGFGTGGDNSNIFFFKRAELVASFTLLGYLIAEYRGRTKEPFIKTARFIVLICLSSGVLLEGIRGFRPGQSASISELILLVVGGIFGSIIYNMQLSAIYEWRNQT